MDWKKPGLLAITVLISCGCGNKAAAPANPQATVMLRDGSSFAGTVTKSSTSEITLQGPNGESRTYPMNQVVSVQYGEAQQTAAANTPPPATPPPATPPPANPPPAESAPAPAPAAAPRAAPPPAAARSTAPAPPQPVEEVRTVPAGTHLSVRNNEAIDSTTAAPGQTYSGVIAQDVPDANGHVVIPRGANATLVVRSVAAQGKIQGQSQLVLDMESVEIAGRHYRLETGDIMQQGRAGVGKNRRTAEFIGGGSALGTILGAVAGGGKGAAIGALSGAAAGTAAQTITRGKGVRVPAETLLTFRLEAPIQIREIR